MPRMLLAAVAAVAFAAAGCHHDDPGPPCTRVVDNELHLMRQMTGHDGMSGGKRSVMIDQCEKQDLPATAKTCLVNAKTLADLATCRRNIPLTPEEIDARNRAGNDRHLVAPPMPPTAPAPGSGSANGSGSGA